MVINFQNKYALPATGEVDATTWNKIVEVYEGIIKNLPSKYAKY